MKRLLTLCVFALPVAALADQVCTTQPPLVPGGFTTTRCHETGVTPPPMPAQQVRPWTPAPINLGTVCTTQPPLVPGGLTITRCH